MHHFRPEPWPGHRTPTSHHGLTSRDTCLVEPVGPLARRQPTNSTMTKSSVPGDEAAAAAVTGRGGLEPTLRCCCCCCCCSCCCCCCGCWEVLPSVMLTSVAAAAEDGGGSPTSRRNGTSAAGIGRSTGSSANAATRRRWSLQGAQQSAQANSVGRKLMRGVRC